jgi:SepF-like predicted cell division protein (DUF552 family)
MKAVSAASALLFILGILLFLEAILIPLKSESPDYYDSIDMFNFYGDIFIFVGKSVLLGVGFIATAHSLRYLSKSWGEVGVFLCTFAAISNVLLELIAVSEIFIVETIIEISTLILIVVGWKSLSNGKRDKDKEYYQQPKRTEYVPEPTEQKLVMERERSHETQPTVFEDDILPDEFTEYGITYVKPFELRNLTDVQKINQELNEENIILLDIALLRKRDPQELKRAVNQLKGICRGIGGDIIGIEENIVLITPSNIRICRNISP